MTESFNVFQFLCSRRTEEHYLQLIKPDKYSEVPAIQTFYLENLMSVRRDGPRIGVVGLLMRIVEYMESEDVITHEYRQTVAPINHSEFDK